MNLESVALAARLALRPQARPAPAHRRARADGDRARRAPPRHRQDRHQWPTARRRCTKRRGAVCKVGMGSAGEGSARASPSRASTDWVGRTGHACRSC